MNISSQFQPSTQMHAPTAPVGAQPWLQSGNHSVPVNAHSQHNTQQNPAPLLVSIFLLFFNLYIFLEE